MKHVKTNKNDKLKRFKCKDFTAQVHSKEEKK